MFTLLQGRTADELWQAAADAFRGGHRAEAQPSRAGPTREILRVALSLEDPRQRWVFSREPALNPAFAIAETVWTVTGRNDAEFLNYFNRALPRFAGHGYSYHGAYGHRLRSHVGFDQLERAYLALKHNPTSRQVVLQIWDARIDLPSRFGVEASPDVPCNIISMLKVRQGKLEWTQVMRSNDLHLGLPYNLVQFTTLQEIMSGWLGLEVGTYCQLSDSLHVYENSAEHIERSQPVASVPSTDDLAVPKEECEESFRHLSSYINLVIRPELKAKDLVDMVRGCSLRPPFRNMLCVVCAEGARRRCAIQHAYEIMTACTNAAYRHLFERWLAVPRQQQVGKSQG
jgi:thymidylate synthase